MVSNPGELALEETFPELLRLVSTDPAIPYHALDESIVIAALLTTPVRVVLFCNLAVILLVLSAIRLPVRVSPSAVKVAVLELSTLSILPVLAEIAAPPSTVIVAERGIACCACNIEGVTG